MKSWTMIICEGGHDRVALASIAGVLSGWQPVSGVPESLPDRIEVAFPRFAPKPGDYRYIPNTLYLTKNNHYLEVRDLSGVGNVLGEDALNLLRASEPDAVGVLVDADSIGVKRLLTQYRNRYGKLYEHAKKGEAGKVWGKDPRLGLWIAPNNRDEGRLDNLLVEVAGKTKPDLVQLGSQFTESLNAVEPGKWFKKRDKALLSAVHQVELPGASLATGLSRSKCWLTESSMELQPVRDLVTFIDELAR